jgi:hypothetical protein
MVGVRVKGANECRGLCDENDQVREANKGNRAQPPSAALVSVAN